MEIALPASSSIPVTPGLKGGARLLNKYCGFATLFDERAEMLDELVPPRKECAELRSIQVRRQLTLDALPFGRLEILPQGPVALLQAIAIPEPVGRSKGAGVIDEPDPPLGINELVLLVAVKVVDQGVEDPLNDLLMRPRRGIWGHQSLAPPVCFVDSVLHPDLHRSRAPFIPSGHRRRHTADPQQPIELKGGTLEGEMAVLKAGADEGEPLQG